MPHQIFQQPEFARLQLQLLSGAADLVRQAIELEIADPIDRLLAYKERMGWQFPYVSTYGSDFPFDFGLALTPEQAQQIPPVREMIEQPPDWLAEWGRQIVAKLEANPVRLYGPISDKNRVAVYLTDLLEHDGQVFIRYTIRNRTQKAYVPGTPQVLAFTAPQYRESPYVLRNSQPSPDAARHVKSSAETPIKVTKSEMRSPRIEPGHETT